MFLKEGLSWLRWWRICLQCRRPRFNPCVGKIPWRREWLPTLVFLPGEFHGQRSLVGYTVHESQRVGHNWTTNTFIFFIKNRCKWRKTRHLVKLSHDSSIIHSTNTRQVSMFLGKSKVLGSLFPGVYTSISRRNKNILCTSGQLYYN